MDKFNQHSNHLSELKTLDSKLFPEFSHRPLLFRVSGIFLDSDREQITKSRAAELIKEIDCEIVIKEDWGFGGSDVKFIKPRELNLNKLPVLPNLIFQPLLLQHCELNKLNCHSVNTIRVITYLDHQGNIDIKCNYLRFSIGKNRVDNVSSGGGFCFIENDGRLSQVAYDELGLSIGNKHPLSGTEFKSIVIPNFNLLKEKCIDSHKKYPYGKIIGWDVAIDEKAEPVLLEWNSRPDMWHIEALKGPFFKEEFRNWDLKC